MEAQAEAALRPLTSACRPAQCRGRHRGDDRFRPGTLLLRGRQRWGQAAATDVVTADFTSDDQVVGQLVISAGDPAWMFVTVHGGGWEGTVSCNVTLSGGQVETIGVFKLSGEYGSWAAPLPSTGGQVRSAELVGSNGTVFASAEVEA